MPIKIYAKQTITNMIVQYFFCIYSDIHEKIPTLR